VCDENEPVRVVLLRLPRGGCGGAAGGDAVKPYCHARNSVKKWGGTIEDYLPIHNFIDSSKAHIADVRHRALLHSSFGIFMAEQVFGVYFTNSAGTTVQVRDVAEEHVLEDLGRIPSVQDYMNHMAIAEWFGGPRTRKPTRFIPLED
jgi:hypothetical protein